MTQGSPFPILWGSDWIRFGKGILVGGVDIDATYSGWAEDGNYSLESFAAHSKGSKNQNDKCRAPNGCRCHGISKNGEARPVNR